MQISTFSKICLEVLFERAPHDVFLREKGAYLFEERRVFIQIKEISMFEQFDFEKKTCFFLAEKRNTSYKNQICMLYRRKLVYVYPLFF